MLYTLLTGKENLSAKVQQEEHGWEATENCAKLFSAPPAANLLVSLLPGVCVPGTCRKLSATHCFVSSTLNFLYHEEPDCCNNSGY